MTNVIVRAQITEVETGTFSGICAPYGEVIEFGGQKERYAPGAFKDAIPVKVYYNHLDGGEAKPVAVIESYQDSDSGLGFKANFLDTPFAQGVRRRMADGELSGLSVNGVVSEAHMDGDVLVYDAIELFEVSIVDRPAYDTARVSVVRNAPVEGTSEVGSDPEHHKKGVLLTKTINMTEINTVDSEARSGLADLEQRFESYVTRSKEDNKPTELSIKSFGEYVKRYAAGDEEVNVIKRAAYSGGTTADSVIANGWTSDIIKIVNHGRPVWNVFSSGQWVNEGSNIEYAKLKTNTISVDSQVAEGDTLPFGKVAVEAAYTPKLTRGGYTEMSLQEISDANVNILSVAFEAMVAEYARATEADVRAALAGAAAKTVTGSLSDADGWVDFIVDASLHLDTKGLSPEFLIVSADRYKALAKLSKADPYVLGRNNGSVNVTGLSGEVLSLPLVLIPGTNVSIIGHSSAIKTFEMPGAPFNLQDENILNLSKQFSIWGRDAVAVQDDKALVKVGS